MWWIPPKFYGNKSRTWIQTWAVSSTHTLIHPPHWTAPWKHLAGTLEGMMLSSPWWKHGWKQTVKDCIWQNYLALTWKDKCVPIYATYTPRGHKFKKGNFPKWITPEPQTIFYEVYGGDITHKKDAKWHTLLHYHLPACLISPGKFSLIKELESCVESLGRSG